MRENDNRNDEQADADWRGVTESIFGANTRANPRAKEQKEHCEHLKFVPNWGNDGISQELIDEEKRGAAEWRTNRGADERIAVDKARKGGGSPPRGNRNSKSTFLDEIDDPNLDYVKVRATGYRESLRSGWEDLYIRDDETIELIPANTHHERASSSSTARPKSLITLMSDSSSSSPPVEANTCVHGVKMKKKRRSARKGKPWAGMTPRGARRKTNCWPWMLAENKVHDWSLNIKLETG